MTSVMSEDRALPIHTAPRPAVRPTVSVVMSCYNSRHVLAQLRSLREQTEPADELVVFDDSTDPSIFPLLERELALHPGRVVLERNATNLGMHRSYTRALSRATCDIVATCDHDDIWVPEKLAVVRDLLCDASITGMVSDASVMKSEEDCPPSSQDQGSLLTLAGFGLRGRSDLQELPLRRLLQGNAFSGATLAFRRTVLETALPLPLDLFPDYWLILCSAVQGPLRLVDRQLVRYRIHAQNTVGVAAETDRSTRRLDRPYPHYTDESIDRLSGNSTRHRELIEDWRWFLRWREALRCGGRGQVLSLLRSPRRGLRAARKFDGSARPQEPPRRTYVPEPVLNSLRHHS